MITLFSLGIMEIGILILAVLFLFGGSKVKGIAKEIIHGYGKVKDVKSTMEKEFRDALDPTIIELEDKEEDRKS